MHSRRWPSLLRVAILCGTLSLSACGGGGGSGPPTTPPPPAGVTAPSNLSYTSPQVFTVGQPITPLTPTVTGTVSSYAVSPTLPAGLALDTTSGDISGTPKSSLAQAKYTVTATNSGGSTTADLVVTINDAAPPPPPPPSVITYPSATVVLATNQPIDNRLQPVVDPSVGTITTWSISPALPPGLSFNNGYISGVPTSDSAPTAYTITATNAAGQYTFVLTLSVHSGVILDLDHAAGILALKFDGTHVFSLDGSGHWILWNYSTAARIASGDVVLCLANCGASRADAAGGLIAIQTQTGMEIRSMTDAHLVSTITGPGPSSGPWKLSPDGSYVVAGSGSTYGLQVWDTATGTSVLTKYVGGSDPSTVYAAAGELRVPVTVGTGGFIETIDIATGVATNSPSFVGGFNEWFADGSRFQTRTTTANNGVLTSTTVYTYALDGTQLDTTTAVDLGILQGNGDWFGSYVDGTLNIYKVGASHSATASYPLDTTGFLASGSLFTAANLLRNGGGTLMFIDVSGSSPTQTEKALPVGGGDVDSFVYSALSPTQWLTGTNRGVLFDGASPVASPRYFDYGAVLSIAGSGARFAIATASGRLLHYNSTTGTLEGTINGFSEKLVFSADGSELAAGGAFNGISGAELTDIHKARVYSLPGESVLSTWPANNTDPPPFDIDLSADGSMFAQRFASGAAAVNPATGGGPTWTAPGNCVGIHLSPDGTQVGCNNQQMPFPAMSPDTWQLFANTSASQGTTLDGWTLGWVDTGHILVDHFYFFGNITPMFLHASVNSATGVELSRPELPPLAVIQALGTDSIYSQEQNAIFAVGSGTATWLSPTLTGQVGAVAGPNVIFTSGHYVLSLPH